MENKIYIFLLSAVLFAGCTSVEQNTVPKSPQVIQLEQKIAQADAFFKQKNYQQAYILYSEAQKECRDIKMFRTLQLKNSAACYEMQNYQAALAALAPMPELPATLNDCQKLVMAATILKKMNGKPEHVESLLEVALDNSINEPGVIPFKAFGYAELGRVYVANRKTARAIKCFEQAQKLYQAAEDEENANACKHIVEYLK